MVRPQTADGPNKTLSSEMPGLIVPDDAPVPRREIHARVAVSVARTADDARHGSGLPNDVKAILGNLHQFEVCAAGRPTVGAMMN